MKTILLAAALVLGSLSASGADKKPGCNCDPCTCGTPAASRIEAGTLDFNSMAFFHEPDGSVKFSRVTTQHRVIGGNAPPRNAEYDSAAVGDRAFFVNGKPVTDAELEAWTSKTVNAKVRLGADGVYFSGGEPAYQIVQAPQQRIVPAGGCPNGRCPTGR